MTQEQAVAGLVQFLSNTSQYQEIVKSVHELKKSPKLFKRLSDFKTAASSGQLSQHDMDSLGREYQQLSQIPEMMRYFQANDRYAEMIGKVMFEINTRLEKSIGI